MKKTKYPTHQEWWLSATKEMRERVALAADPECKYTHDWHSRNKGNCILPHGERKWGVGIDGATRVHDAIWKTAKIRINSIPSLSDMSRKKFVESLELVVKSGQCVDEAKAIIKMLKKQ